MDRRRGDGPVLCIACGAAVAREDAREYDRHGNRWEREGKEFEFLCKACHDDECHQPRGGLEDRLITLGDDHADVESFIAAYYASLEQPGGREAG